MCQHNTKETKNLISFHCFLDSETSFPLRTMAQTNKKMLNNVTSAIYTTLRCQEVIKMISREQALAVEDNKIVLEYGLMQILEIKAIASMIVKLSVKATSLTRILLLSSPTSKFGALPRILKFRKVNVLLCSKLYFVPMQ